MTCRNTFHRLFLTGFLVVVLLAGCDSKRADKGGKEVVSTMTGVTWMKKNDWVPVTEQEANRFGEEMIQALDENSRAKFTSLANIRGIWGLASSGLLSGREADGFVKSASKTGAVLFQTIASTGTSYKLVRVKKWEGGYSVLMRLVDADGACNYHEWFVAKSKNRLLAVDLYVLMSGENLSETTRRLVYTAKAAIDPTIVDRLTGRAKAMAANGVTLKNFFDACRANRYDVAMGHFRQLPAELRTEKTVLLNRLMASMKTGDDEDYLLAIEAYRQSVPEDASSNFACLDSFILKEQFEEAGKAIDVIIKQVGDDAHLLAMKGSICYEQDNQKEAERCLQNAIDLEAEYEDAYWALILVHVATGNFSEASETVRQLNRQFGYTSDDFAFEIEPIFADYVQSAEYKTMIEELSPVGDDQR